VTVCIAATCKHKGETAIVLCCDWQGTKGDFIKSDSVDKFRAISTGSALIAGDETSADDLLNECDQCITQFVGKTDSSTADIDAQAYKDSLTAAVGKRKQALVKEHVMLTRALDIQEFWDHGRAYLGDIEHAKTLQEIRDLGLGCSVIIASIDAAGGDTIIRILSSGRVIFESPFVTIGTGGLIAEAFLSQYDWDGDIGLDECLYRVFLAKIAAEKSPHVGPATSFEVLIGRKRFDLTDKAFDELKKKVQPSKSKHLSFKGEFLEEIKDDEDNLNASPSGTIQQ